MFLSHPKENNREAIHLVDHLLCVAERSKLLIKDTEFNAIDTAFYSGLLHDMGKLNPWYQESFSPQSSNDEPNKEYVQKHSVFSAWTAYHLLYNNPKITEKQLMQIACVIAGHHTRLKNSPQGYDESERFKKSQNKIYENLCEFSKQVKEKQEFTELSWNKINKFKRRIQFAAPLEPNQDYMEDYLETNAVFSSLLQADQGSFNPLHDVKFNIDIDTSKYAEEKLKKSELDGLRTEFQNKALSNHNYSSSVSILQAPTGIGKTKLFLDMIPEYRKEQSFERVYYFSPLLALTRGFIKELKKVITKTDQAQVLDYNHAFASTIDTDEKSTQLDEWRFETESFNEPFIITTMQRFLMTLYSNSNSDKLKFISFKKSLFILDEVQTIPKFLLPNILCLLDKLCKKMNSKAILLSATIPHELKNSEFPITKPSDDLKNEYMEKTKKHIEFSQKLILPEISSIKKPILVMNNTRAKATKVYNDAKEKYGDKIKIVYLSSGIRKCTREEQIENLGEGTDEPLVVVSTQVMEAGVDVSFSKMFREIAPLDNIIQAMGRLDREGEASANTPSTLTVFETDNLAIPYSQLEFEKSLSIIKDVVKETGTSEKLYEKLDCYYEDISLRNESNRDELEKLEGQMKSMDFEGVWEIVRKCIHEHDYRDVIVPLIEKFDDKREELIRILKGDDDTKIKKKITKRFANYTASLPISPNDQKINEYFDDDINKYGILFPKKEYINELYDENIGLDKWTKKP